LAKNGPESQCPMVHQILEIAVLKSSLAQRQKFNLKFNLID